MTSSSEPAVDLETARLLHDGVLQILEYMATAGYGVLQGPDEYRALAARAASELRGLIDGSEPADRDLATALCEIVGRIATPPRDMRVQVDVEDACRQVPVAHVQPLVLAAREAVANALQHSRGQVVSVRCFRAPSGGLAVDVKDDGDGLPAGCQPGFGIRSSIVGRVTEVGGLVRIDTAPSAGTRVHMELSADHVEGAAS